MGFKQLIRSKRGNCKVEKCDRCGKPINVGDVFYVQKAGHGFTRCYLCCECYEAKFV